jgi:CSLREA domain-containing protein
VTSPNDSGAGTLRALVGAANDGDTIDFDPSLAGATITLTTGQITISQALTIDGGTRRVTISGGHTSRIFEVTGDPVAIKSLTIRDGNFTGVGGGGGLSNSGTLTLTDVTVAESVSSANGGGVRNVGHLTMNRCTVFGNVAANGYGGGIENTLTGTVSMTNCTVDGNWTNLNGGGIDNALAGSTVSLLFCTISDNVAIGLGGGVYTQEGDENAVTSGSSIIAKNTAFAGNDCVGTLVSANYNVLFDRTGCSVSGTTTDDVTEQDPKLGSLELNGGLTPTRAVLRGSSAIDRIPAGSCAATTEDQRGYGRPKDGDANATAACDSGAYEAARPIVVTSTADAGGAGTCTLRQALTAANTNAVVGTCAAGFAGTAGPDRIVFDATGTITVATPLVASEAVMVEGPGADQVIVSGAGTNGVFELQDGAASNAYVISGLTIANGRRDFGAGVNFTFAADDTLALDRVFFKNNAATSNGGSLYTASTRRVEIHRSAFVNTAVASSSSGVIFDKSVGILTNTTVGETGGAFAVTAVTSSAGAPARVSLTNCTIKGTETAGVAALSFPPAAVGDAVAEYRSTIVAGHSFNFQANGGTLTSRGYNVSTDATGNLNATGDQPSTDPKLGVLTFNGGPTPTFNLKLGSPAIDVVPASALGPKVDQRGFRRGVTAVDAGAVERVLGGDVNGDGTIDIADVFYLINFLFASGPVPVLEADVNGDGAIDIADAFYLINLLFASGPAPV